MNHTAIFQEQIPLTPRDLSREISSIDEELASKLRNKLEGKCSRHGFVIPGSVNILSRSMGAFEKGRFTGSILFYIQAEGEVLNPPEGSILEGLVIRKNKMGIYVSYGVKDSDDAIRVIVPRDLHIGSEEFEKVEIGQRVRVQIKKSRFQINDPYILSVGLFLSVVASGEASIEASTGASANSKRVVSGEAVSGEAVSGEAVSGEADEYGEDDVQEEDDDDQEDDQEEDEEDDEEETFAEVEA